MPLKILNRPVRTAPGTIDYRFSCIDAAYWVIESLDSDLKAKLATHGFATEPCDLPMGGGW